MNKFWRTLVAGIITIGLTLLGLNVTVTPDDLPKKTEHYEVSDTLQL